MRQNRSFPSHQSLKDPLSETTSSLRFGRTAVLFLLSGIGTVGCAGGSDGANASGGANANGGANATGGASASGGSNASGGANANGGANTTGGASANGGANATGGASANGGANATGGASASGGSNATGGASASGGSNATGGANANGGSNASGGANANGGSNASGGSSGRGGSGGAGGSTGGAAGGVASGGSSSTGGATGTGGGATIDPTAPLTPVAFFPSKQRTNACADASVSIQFNRPPTIKAGGKIQILDASGAVFDSVTANPASNLYFADLVTRTSGGQSFKSEVLDVVFNTVVFHPKSKLELGKTYRVTVDQGMITDSAGNSFAVKADEWSFTVRASQPGASSAYTLAADGSGDFCSLEGVLQALPDSASTARVITVKQGVYPGIVRMSDSNVRFVGAGIDQSVFAQKNAATMNSSSREGIGLTGSDVTFENLTIFNTYLQDSNGQQAEALYVKSSSQRVFLNNVHLRSHQDTLRVDGPSVYMKGGKISGSTDPLWGTGSFYCDGCELASRTSGHAFIVARSTKGFAVSNCKWTKESASVSGTYLAQVHDGAEPGKIAVVNCKIDSHIVGWRTPVNSAWYEYNNTDLSGKGVTFNGTQLKAGSAELTAAGSAQSWLGWSP